MLIKIIAFIAAAIPIVLFLRAIFFRKPTRMSENLKAFKAQLDLGVWIFLGLIAIVSAIALGRLAWAWLTTG